VRHILRFIFAISVHDQYRVARPLGINKAQTDGDRALMTQVAAQTKALNADQIFEFVRHQISGCGRRGTIVEQ
jgi:hypothetical protein